MNQLAVGMVIQCVLSFFVWMQENLRNTLNLTNKKSATFVEKLLEILGHILPVVECARNMQNCKNITNLVNVKFWNDGVKKRVEII